jgi:saccharopine dehydrogenase (NAD+, L-lysine forming)
MRIFVLGTGATGSLLAHLLHRQGHEVICGDKDTERARRFLGRRSPIEVRQVNARNLWSIVRAARRAQLIVNASSALFNEIVLRAALRLRAHYLDMASHLTRSPFKAEQLRYSSRFEAKRRAAVINAGAAPGLTNLLARRAADQLDRLESVEIRLFEETESDDPVSQWSARDTFDEFISLPRIVRHGRFRLARRFAERERFRFPPPIGDVGMVLTAQDEVATFPYVVPLRSMDVKIGGNEIERMRRWYRQGKLTKSRGPVGKRFPRTLSPRAVARLIRRGVLRNARFAVAVRVRGEKREQPQQIRFDCLLPSLYQIRLRGLHVTPVTYATAVMAAIFIHHFPREQAGVFAPEALPAEIRRAVLAEARQKGFRYTQKITPLDRREEEEEEL